MYQVQYGLVHRVHIVSHTALQLYVHVLSCSAMYLCLWMSTVYVVCTSGSALFPLSFILFKISYSCNVYVSVSTIGSMSFRFLILLAFWLFSLEKTKKERTEGCRRRQIVPPSPYPPSSLKTPLASSCPFSPLPPPRFLLFSHCFACAVACVPLPL